jgi:hypothetical protein
MSSRDVSNFLSFCIGLLVLSLLGFGILKWLNISTGNFLDWVIGIASLWWLIVIVTVPWNIHFEAKATVADAIESNRLGITVDTQQLRYATQIAQRSLWVAIALHIFSALGLYALAASGISTIGYISSAATLLLTALRPAISFYQYLADRLQNIRQGFKYPREDVVELRQQVTEMKASLERIEYQLNLEHVDSWAATQERTLTALRQDLTQIAANQEDLRATNQADHQRLERDARNAIAQISADGQFLEHVREIIRFVKSS